MWAEQEVIYTKGPDRYGPNEFSVVDFDPIDVVIGALGQFAEEVTEELTVPWPHDPEEGYVDHEPDAEIRGDAIHAWFGSKESPVLTVRPIPLSEIAA